MSALAAALNWQTYEQLYLYAAAILFNGAVSLWWYKYLFDDLPSFLDFICHQRGCPGVDEHSLAVARAS